MRWVVPLLALRVVPWAWQRIRKGGPFTVAIGSVQSPRLSGAQTDYTITSGQANAIGTAKEYLSYSAFSRSGVIGQLKYEGVTEEDAS